MTKRLKRHAGEENMKDWLRALVISAVVIIFATLGGALLIKVLRHILKAW